MIHLAPVCVFGLLTAMVAVVVVVVAVDLPAPPEILSIECKKRSAKLRWTATGQAEAKEFKIQYMTNWAPNQWFDREFVHPLVDEEVPLILSPWANYTFRVISVNNMGASNASAPSDWCVTEEDVPHKNPSNVYGRGNGPKNLVISWQPMPPIEHNAPGFFYRVFYRLNDEPNAEWHERHVLDWQQHRLVIENLPKQRPYLIRVEAHNSLGGARVEANEVIGFSDEDRPSEAPKLLRKVEEIDGKSARLSWEAVPPMSLNGHFKGYKVQVWTDSYENRSEQIVSANETKALINILTPAKRNYIQVLAFNGAFDGPPSSQIFLDTPQDIYPDPPAFVWMRHTNGANKYFLRITYEPNVTNNNPGDKIYVEYRRKSIDSLDEWQKTVKEDISEVKEPVDLVDLFEFNTFYEIRVVAESGELRAYSNITIIDTGLNKWPQPTTTTTQAPPVPQTFEPYIPRGHDTESAPIHPGPDFNPDNRGSPEGGEGGDLQGPDADAEDNGFSKTHWFIALVCVLAFICAFVGVFIFLKRRRTGSSDVNRKPARGVTGDKIRSTTMTASNTNESSEPHETNSFIVIDTNVRNGRARGRDEVDDTTGDDDQHRDVYNGTTESVH